MGYNGMKYPYFISDKIIKKSKNFLYKRNFVIFAQKFLLYKTKLWKLSFAKLISIR